MTDPQDHFEVLPAGEMRKKYGLTAENRPEIRLNPENVPEAFRPLIPFAELWGVGDDLIREDLVLKAPLAALRELREAVKPVYFDLGDWLAEVESPDFTDEWRAFSCMVQVYLDPRAEDAEQEEETNDG
jgi:hypothetical protein